MYLWKSYYTRHIFPGIKVQLVPVYDFRDNEGLGVIFFQIKSLK